MQNCSLRIASKTRSARCCGDMPVSSARRAACRYAFRAGSGGALLGGLSSSLGRFLSLSSMRVLTQPGQGTDAFTLVVRCANAKCRFSDSATTACFVTW